MHSLKLRLTQILTVIIMLSLTFLTPAANLFAIGAFAGETGNMETKKTLWKISLPGNNSGVESTAYILGTIFVSPKDIFPLNAAIEAAYTDSNKVVIAADTADTTNVQVTSALLKYGLLEQTSIDKLLEPRIYQKADTLIKKYTGNQKSLADYKRFKPWVIESLLDTLVFSSDDKYEQNGMDTYFIKKAAQDKKEILKLETPAFQFKLLSSPSYSVQNMKLENTLNHLERYSHTANKLFDAWLAGDLQGMSELLFPDFGDNQTLNESYHQILLERNRNTAEKIKKVLLASGKCFIITDISLMTGEQNVLTLLSDIGLKVESM